MADYDAFYWLWNVNNNSVAYHYPFSTVCNWKIRPVKYTPQIKEKKLSKNYSMVPILQPPPLLLKPSWDKFRHFNWKLLFFLVHMNAAENNWSIHSFIFNADRTIIDNESKREYVCLKIELSSLIFSELIEKTSIVFLKKLCYTIKHLLFHLLHGRIL